ncbi:hypothetical protein ACLOJK_021251 [Asimina triloba]
MHAFQISIPCRLCFLSPKPFDADASSAIRGLREKWKWRQGFRASSAAITVMRDRSKNRKPLQRGRISNEAIQTVQLLKRAKDDPQSLDRVLESKARRLIKMDLIAVLRELQRQNEPLLALKIFEDIRKEYWYKPQLSGYADMVAVLASNELFDKVELLLSYLKSEIVDADVEGFNTLLKALMEHSLSKSAMEFFNLMKEAGCGPDESTFRILIKGFEAGGEAHLSAIVRQEAEEYFGGYMEFLDEETDRIKTVKY